MEEQIIKMLVESILVDLNREGNPEEMAKNLVSTVEWAEFLDRVGSEIEENSENLEVDR